MAKHTRSDLRGLDLEFSTVFITGATSGMGYELAKRFLARKTKVIAIGRNHAKLQELKDLGAITQQLDLGNSGDIQKAGQLIDEHEPSLIYHAAGGTEYGTLIDRSQESLVHELRLHLESLVVLLHHFGQLPCGNRLFMGFASALAYTPCAGMGVYSSCKRAIWTLCRLSDIEYKTKGFRILTCQAGPVVSDFHTRASHGSYQERSAWSLSVEEATDLIVWQTSKRISSYPIGPMAWLAWLTSKWLPFRLVAQVLYRQAIKRTKPAINQKT